MLGMLGFMATAHYLIIIIFMQQKQCHLPNILQPKQIVLKHPSVTLNNKEVTTSKKRYLLRTTEQKGFCSGVSIYTTKIIPSPPPPLKKKLRKNLPPSHSAFFIFKAQNLYPPPNRKNKRYSKPTTSNHKNREGYNHQKTIFAGNRWAKRVLWSFFLQYHTIHPLGKRWLPDCPKTSPSHPKYCGVYNYRTN